MSLLFIFVLGYFLGGFTALIVISLTVAARRGDSGSRTYVAPPEETVAA